MDKIVSLTGRPIAGDSTTDPKIITRLEDALDRARRGEIIAVAIAEIHRNGSTRHGWIGSVPISILGEVTRMSVHLAQSLDE